jgi:hypothetical protein
MIVNDAHSRRQLSIERRALELPQRCMLTWRRPRLLLLFCFGFRATEAFEDIAGPEINAYLLAFFADNGELAL